MIIEQYGIRLKRVEFNDIELIRRWRNDPTIRKVMEYKKRISKEMQQEWFQSINTPFNYYFLIMVGDEPIGVLNCKNINLEEGYGEGGIFVWKHNAGEYTPVFASLCFLNVAFTELDIFNKSFIKVHKENKKAIVFNRSLGYVLVPGQQSRDFQYYVLTREDYKKKSQKWIKLAEKLSGDKGKPKIWGVPGPLNLDVINEKLSS